MNFSHYIEEKANGSIELSVKGPFVFVLRKTPNGDEAKVLTLSSMEDEIKLVKEWLYNLEALQQDLKILQSDAAFLEIKKP